MKELKKNMPKITFRPGTPLYNRFRKLCKKLNLVQDGICIHLVDKWTKEQS